MPLYYRHIRGGSALIRLQGLSKSVGGARPLLRFNSQDRVSGTKHLDRALQDCVEDDIVGSMDDATVADYTALRPLALKLAKVYKPCALQIKRIERGRRHP